MSKTVLITGSAKRIGREMALFMAKTGWDVVIHYRNHEAEANLTAQSIRELGQKAWLAKADLLVAEEVAALIPSLVKQGIHLDCLINNASLFEKDTLETVSQIQMERHFGVNLYAPLQLIRDFKAQHKAKDGLVITITDGMHGWSLSPAFLSYTLSKQALNEATKLLVRDLAPTIRINAIAPGATLEGLQDKQDTFEKVKALTPLARTSTPQEICDALAYLLAAPCITGQVIELSGGIGS